MPIDALSLVVCTMMGLALGVDYSLLIVSRFREELAAGREPYEAALRSRATAGRTTLFAGATLFASLVLSAFVQPGSLLLSLATTVGVATISASSSPSPACPACSPCSAPGSTPARSAAAAERAPRSRVAAAASAALRRPGLRRGPDRDPADPARRSGPRLDHGAPGVDELPTSNQARQNAETIDAAVGAGWEAPFVLVAAAPKARSPPASASPCSAAGRAGSPPSPASGP